MQEVAETVEIAPLVEPERRGFLRKTLAVIIGGLALFIPGAAGVAVLLDPLWRTRGAAGFIRITTLDSLPPDGTPRRFPVVADKTDAWSKFPSARVGAVYLQRVGDSVLAFNTICPHLGCSVDAIAGDGFHCPCHDSRFHANGELAPGSVSPRGLDALEVDPEALKRGIVQVRFQNFITGTPKRIPRT